MKQSYKYIFLVTPLLVSLYACGNSDSQFTQGSVEQGVTPSAFHISLASSEVPAEVFTGTLADAATWAWAVNHEVEITVVVGDNNNLKVSGGIVRFDVDYGLLSATSCVLSNGECTIRWFSEGSAQAPVDNRIALTAWIMGEETYIDIDDSGNFNDGDILVTDTGEPYVDIDHSGTFSAGDELIDVDNNSIYTPADSLFNGANCTHSTLCSLTNTSIPIYDILLLSLDARS